MLTEATRSRLAKDDPRLADPRRRDELLRQARLRQARTRIDLTDGARSGASSSKA